MSAGMVATAVALTESGILVNGLCVTDLLSGYEVRCTDPELDPETEEGQEGQDGHDSHDGTDGGTGAPVFRGSVVPLHRLEAVRELVEEVLEARAADPELTSANPVVPRTVFPWGIGAHTTDILVTGPDKDATAAYLRMTGVRARTVDVSQALRLAGDLAEAQAEVADPAAPPVAVPDEESDQAEKGGRTLSRRVLILTAVSVTLVGLVVGVGLLRPAGAPGASDTSGASGASETAADAGITPVQDRDPGEQSATTTAAVPDATGWRELSPGDRAPAEVAGDPVTAVSVDVAGWRMTESTSDSEIWTSDDVGMRVLIAARPTPVGTQGELDAAMLGALDALDGLDGDGDIRVTDRSPVAYEEYFPDSTTSWRVRLVDGHQVSVGCQYREASDDRREVCERFTATARVTAATG